MTSLVIPAPVLNAGTVILLPFRTATSGWQVRWVTGLSLHTANELIANWYCITVIVRWKIQPRPRSLLRQFLVSKWWSWLPRCWLVGVCVSKLFDSWIWNVSWKRMAYLPSDWRSLEKLKNGDLTILIMFTKFNKALSLFLFGFFSTQFHKAVVKKINFEEGIKN